jgi:hypothetical protein
VTTLGFGVIAMFEHFANGAKDSSSVPDLRSNRRVYILLGVCVLFGNLFLWAPAIFGW